MRGRLAIIDPGTPQHPYGGVAQRVEGARVLVSLSGYKDHAPVPDPAGFLAHARSMPHREIENIVTRGIPLTEVLQYRVPANVRRRYDLLERFPEGFLVIGDAICAFNPIYAQGMTVATLEALALEECLNHGTSDLARRFFRQAQQIAGPAWQTTEGNDRQHLGIKGPHPWISYLLGAWMGQVFACAERDEAVSLAFVRVANLVDPPQAFHSPRIFRRVIVGRVVVGRWQWRERQASAFREPLTSR